MKRVLFAAAVAAFVSISVTGLRADSTVAILDNLGNLISTAYLNWTNPAGCEALSQGATVYYEYDHEYTWWVCSNGHEIHANF